MATPLQLRYRRCVNCNAVQAFAGDKPLPGEATNCGVCMTVYGDEKAHVEDLGSSVVTVDPPVASVVASAVTLPG